MLQWWSNPPNTFFSDTHTDDNDPETPAPLFAVRAFKQALFGTPKPSTTRLRHTAATTWQDRARDDVELLSPTKRGILLTPGTGSTARRKTVTFGRQLQFEKQALPDAEPKPTPKAVPGKFPSPWVSKTDEEAVPIPAALIKRSQPRSIARTSSMPELPVSTHSTAYTPPKVAPESPALGVTHWKAAHDALLTLHTTEMRKATKKEQLAKKYAKYKDTECTRLSTQLATEQAKALKLERKLAEYVERLAQAVAAAQQQHDTEPRTHSKSTATSANSPNPTAAALDDAKARVEALERSKASLKGALGDARNATDAQAQAYEARIATLERETRDLRAAARTITRQKKSDWEEPSFVTSDIWADLGATHETKAPEKRALRAVEGNGSTSVKQRLRRSPRKHDSPVEELAEQGKEGQENGSGKSAQGMTQARREAARRRLEEKRRQRETAG